MLSDIELAQSMQESAKKKEAKPTVVIIRIIILILSHLIWYFFKKDKQKPPHPFDVNYDLLKCKLTLVDKKSDEFKVGKNAYSFRW